MLEVLKVDGGYAAKATPPHVKVAWSSTGPMSVSDIFAELRRLGAHPQDIGDAFYEADPNWSAPKA